MAIRIPDFDTYREGYGSATITVYKAGTTVVASLFADEAGTIPLANPQTLTTTTINNRTFGRWAQPVYVNESYYWDANAQQQSGAARIPLFTLDGANGNDLLVTAEGGTVARALSEHAGQFILVENFGTLDNSSANNTTVIQAAIGAAAALGGGYVILPAGIYPVNSLTLPAAVVLVGAGRGITTLQMPVSADFLTMAGDRSGFADITLDGVSKQSGSVGVKAINRARLYIRDAEVKRFDTGLYLKGGTFNDWRGLIVTDHNTGLKLHGDTTDSGSAFQFNIWDGGEISICTTIGVDLSYESAECSHNALNHIKFSANATAVRVNGARFTEINDPLFTGNTIDVDLRDDDAVNVKNTVVGFKIAHGYITGGTIKLRDTMQDTILQSVDIRGVTIDLTTPKNALKLENCTEDTSTTITGDGTKLVRNFSNLNGLSRGVTTGSSATKAWSLKLDPGEMCAGIAFVTGKQRNGTDKASYIISFTAQRAPSTLAYDAQTSNFTVGNVLTGATSGATARIIADSDSGLTGTLTLHSIAGEFVDNELIGDGAGGAAQVNGALVAGSVSILDQDVLSTSETDATWAATLVGTVEECEVQVTGAAAKTIDWVVSVYASRFG